MFVSDGSDARAARGARVVRAVLVTLAAGMMMSGAACSAPMQPGIASESQDAGVLQGVVTIGPICPVEQLGHPCPTPPAAYAARAVLVYTPDRSARVATVAIDSTGHYRVALDPGSYLVDINHAGIDHSPDVPRMIEIMAGHTVELDIAIDTGIR